MKNFFLIMLLFFGTNLCLSQQLFYSDVVYGGVTGNGGSTGSGFGSINFPLQIPSNSNIKKAYLIAARDSLADDITVTLNSQSYTFSNSTIITSEFNSITNFPLHRPKSSIHAIDVTLDIDSSINNYTLNIPSQPNSNIGMYTFFYLYVVFENITLTKMNCHLFFNNQNVAPITNYNLTNMAAIINNSSVALSIATSFFCDTVLDGSYINVNGNNLGVIGGVDLNSNLWTCAGTFANFAHYNDSIFGLDDDVPDSLMKATDALAEIKSYVNDGDTAIDITFTYQTLSNSNGGVLTNPIRVVMLSYSTPCDTFSTSITTTTDTICPWGSTQLQATGGSNYSWFGAFGGLDDSTIANPVASPNQTTTYICTITNDSGCVKTEQVKIWVDPCVGIDELNKDKDIIIYPNPTTGRLTIVGETTIKGIQLLDVAGREIMSFQNSLNSIDVTGIPSGIYFLKIELEEKMLFKKFVKQ